ncbi:MAG: hypothetical protein J6333_12440 [Planctomycetes bacterium]|nr:hypothetical protein [Planctomycetota bacterium]
MLIFHNISCPIIERRNCLFDAALLAGFSRHPLTVPEEAIACAVVAAMALPVFVLRKYVT